MRKITFNLLLLFTLLISENIYASNLPDELLNIPITLLSGEQTALAKYNGKKPVYLKFWATWCQPCRKEMPHFEYVQNKYGSSIEVIGINIGINDNKEAIEETIKEFGLTMPMAIDKSGDLAQSFHFIGTPYHLLFDKNMNLIHLGHKADDSLDNKLALVSQTHTVNLLDSNALLENEKNLVLNLNDGNTHALFFTATWCDWYLKESRPNTSRACVSAQKNINALSQKLSNIKWHGFVSRLWTGEQDLIAYKKKYKIKHDVEIDKSNQLFHQYLVKDLPTLILIKNDKIIFNSSELGNKEKLELILSKLQTKA